MEMEAAKNAQARCSGASASGRIPFHAHSCAPTPRLRPIWHPTLRTAATPKVPPALVTCNVRSCLAFQALHTPHHLHGWCPAPAGRQALTRQERRTCIVAVAAAAAAAADGHPAHQGDGLTALQKAAAFQQAFWKFLRPHTIRGTILGSATVTARALIECPIPLDWGLLPRALLGVLALLAGNGYIVGINQIYDVDIDAVNKPFLPIAAGELSPAMAWVLCVGLAAAGMSITAANFGREITLLYSLGLFLGTIYSVPPFHLKRFAVTAFLIIAAVRGFLLNFGVYSAARAALGLPFQWSPSILFITCFVTVFATAIAVTKDLADVEGDRKYGIQTFSTRLGTRRATLLGSGLLALNFAGAAAVALRAPHAFRVPLMVGAQALFSAYLYWETARVDAAAYSQGAIAAYYRGIWNLFYAQYAILPFI